jgi:hypothetical protein
LRGLVVGGGMRGFVCGAGMRRWVVWGGIKRVGVWGWVLGGGIRGVGCRQGRISGRGQRPLGALVIDWTQCETPLHDALNGRDEGKIDAGWFGTVSDKVFALNSRSLCFHYLCCHD